MALKKEEILEDISEMSVMDIVDLISAMEEKFGVSAAAPVAAVAAAPSSEESDNTGDEAASTVDLHLSEVGEKKVDVIKAVRKINGLGLKAEKALVDEAPSTLKEGAMTLPQKYYIDPNILQLEFEKIFLGTRRYY